MSLYGSKQYVERACNFGMTEELSEVEASKYAGFFFFFRYIEVLNFRHRASCILGQAFHYSPENAFYIFNQQIYFII